MNATEKAKRRIAARLRDEQLTRDRLVTGRGGDHLATPIAADGFRGRVDGVEPTFVRAANVALSAMRSTARAADGSFVEGFAAPGSPTPARHVRRSDIADAHRADRRH